ncbi:glycolipid transfer protein domain-containing protein [Ephemerocybe angulata]|uniref:Glycolipid transfer protein domain-containing protein n=1 Tax=Ephemerocybe angulata TaxID=980116 RepID=A0A8H6IAV5_9AGAR|nr:glycolipid transfer protein domain-containing protein [Tulosesus angulatus]
MSVKPHFETVKSFADVPMTNSVETQSFLEASDGLVEMFDLFGSGVFGFVQSDLRSNINGVRKRYEAWKDKSGTLEVLVASEFQEEGSSRYATACLVRLTRGLSLTCKALQHMQSDRSLSLHVCFKRSYDEVLRHHHSFVIRSVVSVAIRAVPYRRDFYERLAQGASPEKLDEDLAKWLAGLDVIVRRISEFLEKGGYGRV